MSMKRIPSGIKKIFRRILNWLDYDIVYFDKNPGVFHRYPYANQESFFHDVKKRGFVPKRMIDIGANRGVWSLELHSVYPDVQSLLVEPNVDLVDTLTKVCENKNGWKFVTAGCASDNSSRKFRKCEDTVSSSFAVGDQEIKGNFEEMQVYSLDHLREEYFSDSNVELIKIDAEGLELEVLSGGGASIRQAEMVMLEVSFFEYAAGRPKFSEIVSRMDEFGFSIYDFTMFYRRPSDFALGLMDCVFVNNESRLRASKAW